MARNSYQKVLTSRSVAASGTLLVDFDLQEIANLQLMVEVTYPSTSATTGMTLNLIYGLGPTDPASTGSIPIVLGGSSVAIFGDTSDSITLETITALSSSPVTKRTVFYLNNILENYPRWLRFSFVNTDPAKAASITIYADA